jgi:Fur family zinc uptake transcriptional regulator|tara:strand:+ start:217 stop:630 length:414 start_codon:yes stop_codon:yes gene_type:complete
MSSNHTHNKKNQTLTKNQRIVLNLLQDSGEPLKAYFILDSLKKEGLNSPLQVYRALDKLVELGKIHKVESLNSFIICNNSNCASNTAFTICERCGKVKEIKNNNLTEGVNELVRENKLNITRYNLEFYVVCKSCKIN